MNFLKNKNDNNALIFFYKENHKKKNDLRRIKNISRWLFLCGKFAFQKINLIPNICHFRG